MAIITPDLTNEIIALAQDLAARFSQPEFIPGCEVLDITDINLYATNNGWIEARCGQHNQQRVRWKSSEALAVSDFVDVMYFADRRVFEVWGVGGSTGIATGSGGYPFTAITVDPTNPNANYSTLQAAVNAASSGDVIIAGGSLTGATTITDKSLTIVADATQGATLTASANDSFCITITGVASSGCKIIGLNLVSTGGGTTSGCIKVGASVLQADIILCNLDATGGSATNTLGIYHTNSGQVNLIQNQVIVTSGTTRYAYKLDSDGSARVTGGSYSATTGSFRLEHASAILYLIGLPTLVPASVSISAGTAFGDFNSNTGALYLWGSGGTSQYVKQTSANGALSVGTIAAADLPSAIDAAKLSAGNVSNTEFDYLDGVTSAIQTQIDGKAPLLSVLNTSGATAAANDVGYLVYTAASGIEYKTTTTVLDDKATQACVVVTGAANDTTIKVATRGRFTIPYTGSAPAAGDYMVFSSTATKLTLSTIMRPEVCAIAMAAGSGGNVDVLLLTRTVFVPYTSAFYVIRVDSASTSDFVALINSGGSGGLTTTNVPYDTISAGAANVIVPLNQGGSELGRMRLYNSTRDSYRLITAVDTANSKITTVASTDSWADNDSITIRSQTCSVGASAPFMIDIDLSQQSEIPLLARAIDVLGYKKDTGTAPQSINVHPFTTFNGNKQKPVFSQVAASVFNTTSIRIPLLERRFCWRYSASGTGTSSQLLDIMGYHLAMP